MAWWVNWLVLLVGTGLLFVFWSWVPLERLDHVWRHANEIGRPLVNTLVLTGLPALYAKLTLTPAPWLLMPIAFLLTQYAVLSGRVLRREMLVAGWVTVIVTIAVWVLFWTT